MFVKQEKEQQHLKELALTGNLMLPAAKFITTQMFPDGFSFFPPMKFSSSVWSVTVAASTIVLCYLSL